MRRAIKINDKVFEIDEAYSILERNEYDSQFTILEPLKKNFKLSTTHNFLQFTNFQIPTRLISHIDFEKDIAFIHLLDKSKYKIKCKVAQIRSTSFVIEIKRILDKETKEPVLKILYSINEKLKKLSFIREDDSVIKNT